MDDAPVVIVGAAMGGLRTAEALRRAGYSGRLVVVGEELHAPYNRPPLSKEVLATEVTHEAVAFPARAATADVEWMLGSRAASADLDAHTVTLEDGTSLEWSNLVIATGLRSRRLDAPPLAGRHAVRTLDDAMTLRAELVPGARVVIIGSGFVGCEVACTAVKLGCEVTIVSPSVEPIIRPLGSMLAAEIRRRHESRGIRFHMQHTIASIDGSETVTGVTLDDGTSIPADVVIEAIGSETNTEWLEGTGLDLSNGVLTDAALRAIDNGMPRDDVYVVGDIARFPNLMFDDLPRRIEHWNIPTDTGKRAGAVLGARLANDGTYEDVAAAPFTPMPAFWSIQLDVDLQAYGLPDLADRVEVLEGELQGDVIVGYFRGERLVGVVGLGMKSALIPYRARIAAGGLPPVE